MTSAGRNDNATQLAVPDSTSRDSNGEKPSWFFAWRESWSQDLSSSEGLSRPGKLDSRKSIAISRAYDEYCRREAAGESIDRSEFCRQFPGHQESLAKLLTLHDYLKQNSLLPNDVVAAETWPEAGETVGGFALLDGLGLGAFARVFIAEEPAVADRRVVVKATVEGAAEVDVLGKLSHPNIVQILSVRQDDERRWTLISMPYLGQATLDDVIWHTFANAGRRPRRARQLLDAVEKINRAGISPEPAPPDPLLLKRPYVDGIVHLVAQLADALAYTHAKGICHRDLKPSNILLAAGGKPMLLDFNLAQDERSAGRRLGGTLPYMAPEQIVSTVLEPHSGPPAIDPRSDLFSLAVIAYELLGGVWPYGPIPEILAHDEFAIELLERQRPGPAPLIERNPEVGAEVSALFQRCLAFDAAERPRTAAELAAELRCCLSPVSRGKRWMRRRRGWVAGAAAMLVLLAGFACYYAATMPSYGQRQLQEARAALDRQDLPAAIRHVNEAAANLPPESKALLAGTYYRIGRAALAAEDYGLAEEYFTHAINRGLETQEVYFHRGAAAYRQAQWERANGDFVKAKEIKPEPHLFACLGDCKLHSGPAKLAQSWYRLAMDGGYETIAVLNNLGLACSLNDANFDEAETFLTRAIAMCPARKVGVKDSKRLALFYNRAKNEFRRAMYKNRKCDDLAKRDIEEAIACDPERYLSRLTAADVYALNAPQGDDDWRKAVEFMEQAIRLGAPLAMASPGPIRGPLVDAIRARADWDKLMSARRPEYSEPSPAQLDVLDDLVRK